MPKQNKLSQHGSALVIVLILIASMMVTTVAVMQSSTNLSQVYAQKSHSQVADNVSQLIGSIMADSNVCLNGIDGPGGEAGLQFTPTAFSLAGAQAPNQLNVSLPSTFLAPAGGGLYRRFQAGENIPDTDLRIDRIYVTGATVDPDMTTAYRMALMAQFSSVQGANVRGLSVRKIMDLRIESPAAGVVTNCGPAPSQDSNRALCEGMNCIYNISPSGERTCFCPIQPMTCDPGHYVSAIVDSVPQCSSAPLERTCPAPSNYLVALDSSSNQVCAEVVTCPAGTSTSGLGGVANPPGCKCTTAGQVWNGSVCGFPSPALCGAAHGSTTATAPTTDLCASGTPSSVSGSGPWAWTCADSFGGPSASCSANLYIAPPPPPPPPAGSLCWSRNGGTSGSKTQVRDPYLHCQNFGSCSAQGATLSSRCLEYDTSLGQTASDATPGDPYDLICQQVTNDECVVTIVAVTCSGGATTTVSSVPASPSGCYCANGQAWNGSSCVTTAVNGACGSATSGSFSTAPISDLCSSGTAGPVSDTGTAWAWTCNGANGGSSASCSAGKAAVTTCPTGSSPTGSGVAINGSCRCNLTTDTWDGSTCQTYAADCSPHYAFDGGGPAGGGSTTSAICEDTGEATMWGCVSPYYKNTNITATCRYSGNTYNTVACARCGPGSNIPAGSCLSDSRCTGSSDPCATPGVCRYSIGAPEDTGTATTICGTIDGSPCTGTGGFGAITGCIMAVGGSRYEVRCVP